MMSVTKGNASLRGSFELDRAPLSIETCQLAGKLDLIQSNLLECILFCDDGNAPLRGSFELDHAPLSIETFQLTRQ